MDRPQTGLSEMALRVSCERDACKQRDGEDSVVGDKIRGMRTNAVGAERGLLGNHDIDLTEKLLAVCDTLCSGRARREADKQIQQLEPDAVRGLGCVVVFKRGVGDATPESLQRAGFRSHRPARESVCRPA